MSGPSASCNVLAGGGSRIRSLKTTVSAKCSKEGVSVSIIPPGPPACPGRTWTSGRHASPRGRTGVTSQEPCGQLAMKEPGGSFVVCFPETPSLWSRRPLCKPPPPPPRVGSDRPLAHEEDSGSGRPRRRPEVAGVTRGTDRLRPMSKPQKRHQSPGRHSGRKPLRAETLLLAIPVP